MSVYTLFRDIVPQRVRQYLRRKLTPDQFLGEYRTWAEASALSRGYGAGAILEICLGAALAVKSGNASYERDGVLFYRDVPDGDVLSSLKYISGRTGGILRILDFGGSFGSLYFRHRHRLVDICVKSWDIVEQEGFVTEGRRHFADTILKFFPTVRAAQDNGLQDVLLCSTAFQYIANPWDTFCEWEALGFVYIIFNNLPLVEGEEDRIFIQNVTSKIYNASYPVRFFSRSKFLERVSRIYFVEKEFASEAVWIHRKKYMPSTGLVLRKRGTV